MRVEFSGLLDDISTAGGAPPVKALESLIAFGEPAAGPLCALLDEIDPDEDDWTPLWVTIALGEIRSEKAVPHLVPLLALPEGGILSEAAVEALAKIGPAALPSLAEFIRSTREAEARHYAYTAVGLIPGEESLNMLVNALQSDPMLWGSIAMALADQGDPKALPVLREMEKHSSGEDLQAVRETIRILEGKQPPYPNLLSQDWHTRYPELNVRL